MVLHTIIDALVTSCCGARAREGILSVTLVLKRLSFLAVDHAFAFRKHSMAPVRL
jgi:hypothetical protein